MDHINLSSGIIKQGRSGERPQGPEGKSGKGFEEVADLQALKKACRDFESIFVHTLLKSMRQSLPKPETLSLSREIYTSVGDLELARSIAHGRGTGLGDLLFKQLKQKVR